MWLRHLWVIMILKIDAPTHLPPTFQKIHFSLQNSEKLWKLWEE
jgi:hypothetical protein